MSELLYYPEIERLQSLHAGKTPEQLAAEARLTQAKYRPLMDKLMHVPHLEKIDPEELVKQLGLMKDASGLLFAIFEEICDHYQPIKKTGASMLVNEYEAKHQTGTVSVYARWGKKLELSQEDLEANEKNSKVHRFPSNLWHRNRPIVIKSPDYFALTGLVRPDLTVIGNGNKLGQIAETQAFRDNPRILLEGIAVELNTISHFTE